MPLPDAYLEPALVLPPLAPGPLLITLDGVHHLHEAHTSKRVRAWVQMVGYGSRSGKDGGGRTITIGALCGQERRAAQEGVASRR